MLRVVLPYSPLTIRYSPGLRRFRDLCQGKYDHLPEAAFYMVGTIEEAASGRWSYLPWHRSRKPLIVSARSTNLPGEPVKTSATWKGCDRKRSTLRARATVILSSSDNSSMPRMAMMSCSDL